MLNERRFDDLGEYVGDQLTYNEQPMTGQDYRRLREQDVDAIPDLRFNVDLLVVEGDRVAGRIQFDCNPVKPFLGFAPAGGRIRFTEHVFYRFADRRIVAVTSLIDLAAIQRQLSDPS